MNSERRPRAVKLGKRNKQRASDRVGGKELGIQKGERRKEKGELQLRKRKPDIPKFSEQERNEKDHLSKLKEGGTKKKTNP